MDNRSEYILKKSGLFNNLTQRECSLLFDMLKISEKSYSKKEIILHEGDDLENLYVIKKGKITGEKFHVEGETNLLNIYEEGDIIGLETASSTFRTAPLTFTADTDAEIIKVPVDKLWNNPLKEVVFENIIHLLSDANIRQMYKIQAISRHSLRERIMTHLIIIRKKKGTENFDIRMTQEQLAQYLCVNRSALSYELNRMKKEGIIDFHRSIFRIKDYEKYDI